MDKELKALLAWCASSALVTLMSANAYFIKRLIDTIDKTNAEVIALHETVTLIQFKLESGYHIKKGE